MLHSQRGFYGWRMLQLTDSYQALRLAMPGFLRKHVNDASLAEDLLHDVFLKALSAGERGQVPTNLPGWLYRIARNRVIDHYRSKRPSEALPPDLMAEEDEPNPTERVLAGCMRPMTEQLPTLYRDALLATDFGGAKLRAIATDWKVSESALKSRVSRGRILLKQSLLDCCRVELSKTGEVIDYEKRAQGPSCGEGSCS